MSQTIDYRFNRLCRHLPGQLVACIRENRQYNNVIYKGVHTILDGIFLSCKRIDPQCLALEE